MNDNGAIMREREISLVDLLVEILLHWRAILIAAVLGGILFGAFSYVRSLQDVNAQNQAAEEQQYIKEQQKTMSSEEIREQWENQKTVLADALTEQELGDVNMALAYKEIYRERSKYWENSDLMQLDPYHIQQANLIFNVQAEDIERGSNIKIAYENLLTGVEFYSFVEEQCGLEDGAEELISLIKPEYKTSQGRNTITNLYGDADTYISYGDADTCISLKILHSDADVCGSMADAIIDYMERQQETLEDSFGGHELVLLSRSQGEMIDDDVANRQKSFVSDLYSLQSSIEKLEADFTDAELAYYEHILAGSPSEAEETAAGGAEIGEGAASGMAAGFSAKYVTLGAVLFAFLYVFLLFLSYILNDKLRGTDNLLELYNIAQLGTISSEPHKRLLGVVDGWILKLRYHNRRKFAPKESLELAGAAVKMAAKKQGIGQVGLIGCKLADKGQAVCENIKAALSSENMEAVILDNVLYDVEAMEKLENLKGAVLVETAGSTLYGEIERELQLLERQKITVLGGIVVE